MRNLNMTTVHSIQESTEASMRVFLDNTQGLLLEYQKRLEQEQKEQLAIQHAFVQSIEASSAALNILAKTVLSSTQLISEDIAQSLVHYSKLNGDIQHEAKDSMDAIENLQNSLSRLGVLKGSQSSVKE
jgi:hypothetical protein